MVNESIVEKLLPNVDFSGYVQKGKCVRSYLLMSSEPPNNSHNLVRTPDVDGRKSGYVRRASKGNMRSFFSVLASEIYVRMQFFD